MTTRIALIHATPLAIDPINEAFKQLWPDAERMNLLDDSLSADREKQMDTPIEEDSAMMERFVRLATYARDTGANAVLFTCSAFGPCIERANEALDIPVLKPNEAMFRAALSHGNAISMLATFEPSLAPMKAEFDSIAQGTGATLHTTCIPDAMKALADGDSERHDALLALGAKQLPPSDAILLAQFSTARAADAVHRATGRPVLTSPDTAVQAIRSALG